MVGESDRRNKPSGSTDAKETRVVLCLKLSLLFLLVGASIGASYLVFWYSSEAEQRQFESRFDDEASKIQTAVRGAFYVTLGVIDTFVVDLASYAKYSGSEWPFVTLPDFAVRAAKVRSHAKAFYVAHNVLVTNATTRSRWDEYSSSNNNWVDEVLRIQREDVNYHGPPFDLEYQPIGTVFGNMGPVDSGATALPIWQNYPMAVSRLQPYNYNILDFKPMATAYKDLFESQRVTFQVINMPEDDDPEALEQTKYVNAWAKEYLGPSESETEPMIALYYPITADASDSVSQTTTGSAGSVVGVFDTAIYWRNLIENILPAGSGEIVIVFEIGDVVFTYALDGPNARYVGQGDLHDRRYNYLEQSLLFLDPDSSNTGENVYTGVPLSDNARACLMRVYPSTEMEATFVTCDPIIYTVVSVLTFVLTSIIFVVYDCLRSSSLRRMTNTVEESTANVMVLEEMVQERTGALETTNSRLEKANREILQKSEAQLRHFSCMSHELRTPLVSQQRKNDTISMILFGYNLRFVHVPSHAFYLQSF